MKTFENEHHYFYIYEGIPRVSQYTMNSAMGKYGNKIYHTFEDMWSLNGDLGLSMISSANIPEDIIILKDIGPVFIIGKEIDYLEEEFPEYFI
jgi:hypothetical protein